MKIAFLDPIQWDYNPATPYNQPLGGSQSALCYLASALADLKQEVFLLNDILQPGIYRGVNCFSLKNIPVDLLASLDFLIVLNSSDIILQLKSFLGQQTKLILWMGHAHDQPAAELLQDATIVNSYDQIVLVSEWQRSNYLQKFPISQEKTVVLKNAIAPIFQELFTEKPSILFQKNKRFTLAYTSTPFRGLELLLDIFPEIKRQIPQVQLKVFSSMQVYRIQENQDDWRGVYRRCQTMAGVEYIGSLPQAQLAQELKGIHLLAYPNSFAETSCISVMEAMASGCHIITSKLGGLPETTHGFASLIPVPEKINDLKYIFNSPDEKLVYGKQFIEQTVKILQNLTNPNNPQVEQHLREQINYCNNSCTWSVRAVEWLQWLENMTMSEKISIEQIYDESLALQRSGNWEDAITGYQKITALQPNYAPAYFQLGNYHLFHKKWAESIAFYQKALSIESRYSQAWYNLGVALQYEGQINEAIHAYQQALIYNPKYLQPYNNLGILLEKQDRIKEALDVYQQALQVNPAYVPSISNLANLQHRCEQRSEASANYHRILQLEPNNLNAMAALVKICQETCQWADIESRIQEMLEIAENMIKEGTFTDFSVFDFIMYSPFPAAKFYEVSRYFANFVKSKVEQHIFPPHIIPKEPPQKLKIGYLAGDYYNHALTHLMVSLFALHDREKFEIIAYSLGPNDGSWQRKKIENDCDKFVDIRNFTSKAAAQKIADDGIHILMDMAGYTQYANPEILAIKPAPIQVNYLTYAATMGGDFMDYIITDKIITPPDLAECFSEKFIYLPDTYQINNNQRFCPAENPRAKELNPKSKYRLPENAFVFCCFNHSRKIEVTIFDTWMKILAQVPDSVLWLLESNPEANINLRREAELRGIKGDRIIFAPRVTTEEHIVRHLWGDLFLDTLYYNAHTTASDALWMGMPVLTCQGKTFASRVASSLLNAVNLAQLVTTNLTEYEHLAVHLATHRDELQELKNHLHDHRREFALFDTLRMARHLESAYQMIWENYQAGKLPEIITVPTLPESEIVKPRLGKTMPEREEKMPETPGNNASNPSEIMADREFISWLIQQGISLACTTYQSQRLIFIGSNPENKTLSAYWRIFDRAMGLYCTPERIYLSSKYQLWQLDNVLNSDQVYQGYDKLFIPRIGYTTGDLDIHDLTLDNDGKIIFIATLLNSLATISDRHSCKPIWKPPFISQLINEDRCHLNGLAMVEGQPKYVTAISQSDVVDGWRDRRRNGGVIIDIVSNEIITSGLSMPHSPRWYQGKLWVLNSGRGELGYIDLSTGQFQSIAFCPGYLRGLAFWQDWAIVGLSKSRKQDHTFGGLDLDDLLTAKDTDARCGLMVINIHTGATIHWLRFEGIVTELYDVQVLANTQRPMALGFQTEEIAQLITLES